MVTPLVKHIVGVFGVVDASNKSLSRWLTKRKSAVLYIGGERRAPLRVLQPAVPRPTLATT